MRSKLTCLVAALALGACGGGGGGAERAVEVESDGNAVQVEPPVMGDVTVPTAPAVPLTPESGEQYVDMLGAADLFEIESARLALDRAENPDVRALAQAILADRQGSTAQLRSAARQARPPLAVSPRLNPPQENDLQALRAAGDGAFEREYLIQRVRAHEQALGLATHYAVNGDVDPLRRHASGVLDPIRRSLSRARDLVVQVS